MSIREISLTNKKNFTNKVILSGILSNSEFLKKDKVLSLLNIGNFQVPLKWNKGRYFTEMLGKHVVVQGRLTTIKRYNDRLKKYISNIAVLVEYMEVVYDL